MLRPGQPLGAGMLLVVMGVCVAGRWSGVHARQVVKVGCVAACAVLESVSCKRLVLPVLPVSGLCCPFCEMMIEP